jgi:hypothetical protein
MRQALMARMIRSWMRTGRRRSRVRFSRNRTSASRSNTPSRGTVRKCTPWPWAPRFLWRGCDPFWNNFGASEILSNSL